MGRDETVRMRRQEHENRTGRDGQMIRARKEAEEMKMKGGGMELEQKREKEREKGEEEGRD
jgi:hypothetical protein